MKDTSAMHQEGPQDEHYSDGGTNRLAVTVDESQLRPEISQDKSASSGSSVLTREDEEDTKKKKDQQDLGFGISESEDVAGNMRNDGNMLEERGSKNPRFALEEFTRCSESHLWKLMMSFYDRKGVKSWSQGIVPHFITCNAFIGRAYAKVLIGFIRDCMSPDAKTPLDPKQPLYIVELGAGSGKFSFFMLKALNAMLDSLPNFDASRIVYVMTDFTQNNLNFWNQHPGLRPYIDRGQLDLAIFDAVNDETIKLHHSGTVLGPGSMRNPVCVVANYLFDTLCHDIFQVDTHQLKEGLISVGSRSPFEPDALDPEIIKRFDNHFRYRTVDENYYHDEDQADVIHFKRILRWYLDYFGNSPSGASILMPIGALRALRRLTAFSKGRALVLSGDKGNNNPEQFRGLMDPHIAVHGSFSVMVNYHAIGLYFISRNGFVLHNPQEEASLKVSAFVLTGDDGNDNKDQTADDAWAKIAPPSSTTTTTTRNNTPPPPPVDTDYNNAQHPYPQQQLTGKGGSSDAMSIAPSPGDTRNDTRLMTAAPPKPRGKEGDEPATRLHNLWSGDEMERISSQRALSFSHLCRVFEDEIVTFGPNDFFVLQKSMKEDSQQPTLKGIVALLKLGDWDPDVFYKFRDVILNQAPVCGCKLRNDLCRDLPRVWDNHYSLDKDKDVSFEVGRFYYGIREHEKALQFYHISTDHIGEHHVTFHNMGLCHYSLGQLDTALENFEKSLRLNPDYEKARSWHQKVSREIERQQNLDGLLSQKQQSSSDTLMTDSQQLHQQLPILAGNSNGIRQEPVDMMQSSSAQPHDTVAAAQSDNSSHPNDTRILGTPSTADAATFHRNVDDQQPAS